MKKLENRSKKLADELPEELMTEDGIMHYWVSFFWVVILFLATKIILIIDFPNHIKNLIVTTGLGVIIAAEYFFKDTHAFLTFAEFVPIFILVFIVPRVIMFINESFDALNIFVIYGATFFIDMEIHNWFIMIVTGITVAFMF